MHILRDDLPKLIRDSDYRSVRAELAAVAILQPDLATCHRIVGLIDQIDAASAGLTPVRVAVLTNYTAEPLIPLLRTHGLPSGLHVETYLPGFDQWMAELLDEGSKLQVFAPQVVVIDLEIEVLAPALKRSFLSLDEAGVERAIGEVVNVFEQALRALRTWSKARAIIHLPPRPTSPPLGILDASVRSQTAAFKELQTRIRELCADKDAFCLDTDRLITDVGAVHWRDHRMWGLARIPYSTAACRRIADEHVRYMRALTGRVRKVLVLDIDDTLWGGILGERGEHGIELGDSYPGNGFVGFQDAVAELRRRGVVLALNSTNDGDHVLDVMRRHPGMVLRPDDFSAHRINWRDKATNMVEIAEELNLALDSCVFIDNSPAECQRMRQALPEVMTYQLPDEPAAAGAWLRGLGVFDTLAFTDEDRLRPTLYRGEVRRSKHREAVGSLSEYLASLSMVMTVDPITHQTAKRAADLSQRTNQFNMTTRRRTVSDLSAWLSGDEHEAYVFTLTDRFGPQGIIGFAALHYGDSATVEITDFMLSCRALKRNVEQAMLAVLLERAHLRADRVIAEYVPTPRNGPFADFYETGGLRRINHSGTSGATHFEHWADDAVVRPAHITVELSGLGVM